MEKISVIPFHIPTTKFFDKDRLVDVGMKLMNKSLKKNERNCSIEQARKDIEGGTSLLWLIYQNKKIVAAFTTCVNVHKSGRETLFIEHLGGAGMKVWMDAAINHVVDFAKKMGYNGIEAEGREGFLRYARSYGFQNAHRLFEMEIG